MSDEEQAFNKWFGDLPDRGDDALFRGWSRSGFNAGYQAALIHSAEKGAEIERLKDIGNTLASSLDALFRGWSRSGFNAGYQAALTHSADKDAEIERLKQSIYRHEIGGSKLAVDNMNLQAEIERLKDIGNTLASSLHVANDKIARLTEELAAVTAIADEPCCATAAEVERLKGILTGLKRLGRITVSDIETVLAAEKEPK